MKEVVDSEDKITYLDCPICGNPASKVTLHLIPWFIIKHFITEGGSGHRDKELSFTISAGHLTKMFTGRSVLPEKIEDFGDLHDLEKEKENPYTRDYLWCSECEKKFSRLEAIFSTEFAERKIASVLPGIQSHNGQTILENAKMDYGIYQLFVQSIFWRCSIGKFDGFALHAEVEKKILNNLKEAFKHPNFLKLKPVNSLPIIHSFPLITSLLYAESGEDPTKNFIVINRVHKPYFIMAGKWLFQLFEKASHINGTHEWLFGLRLGVDVVKLFPKIDQKSHTILISKELTEKFTGQRLKYFSEKKLIGLQRTIRELHANMFGPKPDAFISAYIQQQYFVHLEDGKTEFSSLVHAFYDLKKLA